ncbi:MAG: hypothetical protein ABIS01_05700 [Ferruginibacter sp.]
MKTSFMKSIIVVLLALISKGGFAQAPPNFDIIKLERTSDYKAADPFALQTANYLLLTPFKNDNPDRIKSLQFIFKWMRGTPDYSFPLDESIRKLLKDNNDLIGLYLAALVKYCLENKETSKNAKVARLNGMTLLLNYCENKDNNIRPTKSLKKLSDAKAKGELEQLL